MAPVFGCWAVKGGLVTPRLLCLDSKSTDRDRRLRAGRLRRARRGGRRRRRRKHGHGRLRPAAGPAGGLLFVCNSTTAAGSSLCARRLELGWGRGNGRVVGRCPPVVLLLGEAQSVWNEAKPPLVTAAAAAPCSLSARCCQAGGYQAGGQQQAQAGYGAGTAGGTAPAAYGAPGAAVVAPSYGASAQAGGGASAAYGSAQQAGGGYGSAQGGYGTQVCRGGGGGGGWRFPRSSPPGRSGPRLALVARIAWDVQAPAEQEERREAAPQQHIRAPPAGPLLAPPCRPSSP